jgi:hypothetical protein
LASGRQKNRGTGHRRHHRRPAASASDNLGYQAAQVGVADLAARVPALAGWQVESEQVAQIDSKDMDFAVWHALAQRCAHWLAQDDVAGLVVTHGTDTMEETAFFLQALLAPVKPVVLTGAMRPATSALADGPQNLADALSVAVTPGARGVCVVFAGAVHGAADIAKAHNYRLAAFSSGDAGPLAYVEEGRLRSCATGPRARRCVRWRACARRRLAAGGDRDELRRCDWQHRARAGGDGVAAWSSLAPATARCTTRWKRRYCRRRSKAWW